MPRWSDLRRFLDRNGKFLYAKKHLMYLYKGEKIRCSHGSGEIGADRWRDILKHQLRITQEEFNAGL